MMYIRLRKNLHVHWLNTYCISFIEMKIGRINEILIDLRDIDFNFKTIELKWSLSWIWKIYTTANTLFNSKQNFKAFRMHDVTISFKEHNSNLMNMVFGYQCCMPLICSCSSIFKAVKFARACRYQLPPTILDTTLYLQVSVSQSYIVWVQMSNSFLCSNMR